MPEKMPQEIDYISDINDRYAAIDNELVQKLNQISKTEELLLSKASYEEERYKPVATCIPDSATAAKQRNDELLKSLEKSKARLRSRATFSPLETILQKAIGNYLKETALVPCSTKKSYGPTYV